jgi:antitoxin MazE
MITRVQKWSDSQGLRLSRQILEDARISVGDHVDVIVRENAIMITPVRRVRGKYTLQQLVARMPKGYKNEEVDWGRPLGREVW